MNCRCCRSPSVLEMLRERLPAQQEMRLHWPNDVYADGKKISGILLESPTPRHVVIGIGINVNNRLIDVPAEFQEDLKTRHVTSMIDIVGTETDHAELVRHFLQQFYANIERLATDRERFLDDLIALRFSPE